MHLMAVYCVARRELTYSQRNMTGVCTGFQFLVTGEGTSMYSTSASLRLLLTCMLPWKCWYDQTSVMQGGSKMPYHTQKSRYIEFDSIHFICIVKLFKFLLCFPRLVMLHHVCTYIWVERPCVTFPHQHPCIYVLHVSYIPIPFIIFCILRNPAAQVMTSGLLLPVNSSSLRSSTARVMLCLRYS